MRSVVISASAARHIALTDGPVAETLRAVNLKIIHAACKGELELKYPVSNIIQEIQSAVAVLLTQQGYKVLLLDTCRGELFLSISWTK